VTRLKLSLLKRVCSKPRPPGLHLCPEMTFENHANCCDLAHDLFDAPKSPGVLKEAFHVLPISILRQPIP
jgi:hypothetical protein